MSNIEFDLYMRTTPLSKVYTVYDFLIFSSTKLKILHSHLVFKVLKTYFHQYKIAEGLKIYIHMTSIVILYNSRQPKLACDQSTMTPAHHATLMDYLNTTYPACFHGLL